GDDPCWNHLDVELVSEKNYLHIRSQVSPKQHAIIFHYRFGHGAQRLLLPWSPSYRSRLPVLIGEKESALLLFVNHQSRSTQMPPNRHVEERYHQFAQVLIP